MKNKKYGSGKTSTKKWFIVAVAFGVIFAITTTFIAIFRNINSAKNEKAPKKDFIVTSENKEGIRKPLAEYGKLDTNIEQKENKNNDEEDILAGTEDKKKKFLKPIDGNIIKNFSGDTLVKHNIKNEYKTHNGIDIKSKKNTPVIAISDGTVTDIVNSEDIWGCCITIKHDDGTKSIYKGLGENIGVKIDDHVKGGDIIGYLGTTNIIEGNTDSNQHLHFELLKKDNNSEEYKWVDPTEYIEF